MRRPRQRQRPPPSHLHHLRGSLKTLQLPRLRLPRLRLLGLLDLKHWRLLRCLQHRQ